MKLRTAGQALKGLPRNIWAVSLTSFFMDISSEMVINLIPLFLANALGARASVIGLIEGVAESTASLLRVFSGWLSDRLRARKWLAVAGYALSALAKPFFLLATSWGWVAGVRWAERVGKGVRTAPRDALVADSVRPHQRGLAFGLHRAADTGGALVGLLVAAGLVWRAQAAALTLDAATFRLAVLASLLPAALAVLALALGAVETGVRASTPERTQARLNFNLRALGKPFLVFMGLVALFDLGNSSDAFLALRAQERGVSVLGIIGMLVLFNLVYTLASTPAGRLSDRLGRRQLIIAGWLAYALVYLGFGLARAAWHIGVLYALYGLYYGLAFGAAKAMVADLVPAHLRGTAYGAYGAMLGVIDLPASLIAGVLWQGVGAWRGLGAGAPFLFGAALALIAALLLCLWQPDHHSMSS